MPTADQSVVVVVADADRDAANAALAAYFGDDPGSENLTIRLSADGQEPPTHWALHIWRQPADASAMKDWPSGILPTPVAAWEGYGLDETSALAAGDVMFVNVLSANASNMQTLPHTNLDTVISALELVRIA